MKLSSVNIRQQEFKKVLKGYDKEEVHTFLDNVALEYDAVAKENEQLKHDLEEAYEKINHYKEIEQSLQDTLLKAQESTGKSIEAAKKQVQMMIKDAELKSQQIMDKSKESADEIRISVIKLREERNLIIAKLKAMVNSQANLFEVKIENAVSEKDKISKESADEEPIKRPDLDINNIVNRII
ncbi:MAG: DivIVA domain-containing protein [Bacteroidota bacterium]|nr:DivIVA domain-containing protein [Bacteroidota bacterium]